MEDDDRLMNVIVKPDVYHRYYKLLRDCFLLTVEGKVQKQGGILRLPVWRALSMERPCRTAGLAEGSPFRCPIHVLRESAILPTEAAWLLVPIGASDPCGDVAHNRLSPCFVQ